MSHIGGGSEGASEKMNQGEEEPEEVVNLCIDLQNYYDISE